MTKTSKLTSIIKGVEDGTLSRDELNDLYINLCPFVIASGE